MPDDNFYFEVKDFRSHRRIFELARKPIWGSSVGWGGLLER
jgi:hypothetical protein